MLLLYKNKNFRVVAPSLNLSNLFYTAIIIRIQCLEDLLRRMMKLLYRTHVKDENLLARMHPTHVGSDIGRMPGAILAIRTIESRQLAALKLQVIVQIISTREHVAALVTRISLGSNVIVAVTMLIKVKRTQLLMHTCEQKRFHITRGDIDVLRCLLFLIFDRRTTIMGSKDRTPIRTFSYISPV